MTSKILVVLATIAVFLGLLGILMLTRNLSGQSVANVQNTNGESYSLNEVSSHNLETDCWIIANEKVYDITRFINFYSEGEFFKDSCGGNANNAFENAENYVKQVLENYKIGKLG